MVSVPRTESRQIPMSNDELAARLDELAELLETQHANPYRVRAYRAAAATLRKLTEPVADLLQREGITGLTELPSIGDSLARAVERLVHTGRLGLLDQLRGEVDPERILATVPGIGPKTAARIHAELGIETLPELEAAAYDGRLAGLAGMGDKRLRAVRESLAGRFRRHPLVPKPRAPSSTTDIPDVEELLNVDEEYRRKAAADRLVRIAPRRFNPTGEAWLPILHTHRGDRHYAAMYSNTARAHELGCTKDWVVIYREGHGEEGQWTVVTGLFGLLKGRRVVRGREAECLEFFKRQEESAARPESAS